MTSASNNTEQHNVRGGKKGTKPIVIDSSSSDDDEDDLDAPQRVRPQTSKKKDGLTPSTTPGKSEKGLPGNGHASAEPSKPNQTAPTSVEDQLKERSSGIKRKAESELSRPPRRILSPNMASTTASSSSSSAMVSMPTTPILAMVYPDGALRITRTPGRQHSKNCVNLGDLIHKQHLLSACMFSFYIADEEVLPHFPLSRPYAAVPIYVGRDVKMDPTANEYLRRAGMSTFTKSLLESHAPALRDLNKKINGKQYNSFYAWSPGSSHSKILALVYPTFLRLVITSCNMMNVDTLLGDNHWYIHDLPKLASRLDKAPAGFEADFLSHLEALTTPEEFLDSIRGRYDYSKVKVQLVTSHPGVCSGAKAEKHGLLRLRRILLDQHLTSQPTAPEVSLEVCAASIGNLTPTWLSSFNSCALGQITISLNTTVPKMKIYYPTVSDIKSSHESAQLAASNIGCHTRPWNSAPDPIKALFHHYESKDKGRLFHQKLIIAYDPHAETSSSPPLYLYIGSANLSQSAWGALELDKRGNEAACGMKLTKISNFECGVVIPGALLRKLMEEGTKDWKDIVPYVQDSKRYDGKDRPWNDPSWVQNFQEDWQR